jgi:copper chaperone
MIRSIIIPLLFINFLIFTGMNTDTLLLNRTVKIKCTEMTCDGCKRSITKSINTLQGITKLEIDLEKKMITVEYDDSKTAEQNIVNAVVEAGYDAELVK